LLLCIKSLKIKLYLALSGLGLGGANAPFHPPWLRYCQGPRFLGAPKFNNLSRNVFEITSKGPQKEKFYVVNVLDKNSFNSQDKKTHSIPKIKNVNGAKFKKVTKLFCL
jgi:hypothetical protein